MRSIRLSLVALPASARAAALAAARAAFPGAEVVELATANDALARGPAPGLELLVLADTVSEAVIQDSQAVDQTGLPRWVAIVMGAHVSELVESVPPEEWNPVSLARIFRSALLQHELLGENLRLRGDLKTVARRFSHDLVTPVGCINTSAAVLKIMPPEETESIATIIGNIEESSAEITLLVERVSFVIRATAEPVVPAAVDMGAIVAGVLDKLEVQIGKARATVALPSSWPVASGVAKWLHVVWWNLVANALRHGGTDVRIQLAWEEEREGYRFSVSDNGAGVPAAIRPGLFRAFDELHSGHGTGLGLSIVQRLTALQGGSCHYEKLPERGSRFTFSLPAAEA